MMHHDTVHLIFERSKVIALSPPSSLLAHFVVYIIHVHAMTDFIFTVGILGYSLAVH